MRKIHSRPVQEILVFIAYAQKPPLSIHVNVISGARALNFDLRLSLPPYFVYEKRKSSG